MKTVTINIYTFDELSEKAKDRAREWWRETMEFSWGEESLESIKTFCDHFDVTLKDWSVGPYCAPYYSTDAANSHFRGIQLSDIDRDAMPTGYYIDAVLWGTFYDVFSQTGDAKEAFHCALIEAFDTWRKDMEYELSDESIASMLTATDEYHFTETGKVWR